MWCGPIGTRFHWGSSVWPACSSTSTIGSSSAVAAPGPSLRRSSSFISQRLRYSMRPNEAKVHVHQYHDQGRQQKHVGREEDLKRWRADHRTALEDGLDECAELWRRRRSRDLDRHLGGEVSLCVPPAQVCR